LGVSALKAAIANAVAEISPDDMDLYEIEADTLILEAIEGRTVAAVKGDMQPRFSLQDAVNLTSTVADYIKVIAAAIQSLKTLGFIKTKPKVSAEALAALQKRWEEELKRAGLEEKDAVLVAVRFSRDLLTAAASEAP
jgi:hypothetical protein